MAEGESYDYDAAALAMLTLRVNTSADQWLSEHDEEIFNAHRQEAVDADGDDLGNEYLLFAMMHMAWYALMNLAAITDESESTWLQRIAVDVHNRDDP